MARIAGLLAFPVSIWNLTPGMTNENWRMFVSWSLSQGKIIISFFPISCVLFTVTASTMSGGKSANRVVRRCLSVLRCLSPKAAFYAGQRFRPGTLSFGGNGACIRLLFVTQYLVYRLLM
jgi:hypothetical protein